MEQLDCLFIGSSTKDLLMLVDSPPMSDQRISASKFHTSLGGVSATAAAAYQSLGGKVGVVTAVGDDDSSAYIQADLTSRSYAYLKVCAFPDTASSTSMIQVERDGKRCLTCYGGCIDKLRFEMLDPEAICSTRILHLGVMEPELLLRLARFCKEETAALLSIDGGNMSRELTHRLLPYTDLFIPDNKTAMKTLGLEPREACRYYVEKGAGFACVTAAELGAYGYDGAVEYHVPSLEGEIVDTTGAGDNFHGSFLYCVNQGWDYRRAMAFASIFASLTCRGLGGREAIPALETVLELMEE